MLSIRGAICLAGLFAFAGSGFAGEKKLMHCFAFTQLDDAKDADWDAFFKATDEMVEKVDGLNKVWYGKLRSPLAQYGKSQEEPTVRQWGVCMEMDDEATLEKYAENEAHTAWVEAYAKVRKPGTTTYDILGQ